MKIRAMAAILVVLAGLGFALSATVASAAAPVPFPKGTSVYYTYDKGYGVVVATAGINVSKTAAFKINANPYNGAVFSPTKPGPVSAFSNYLQQIGEWVYGPGKSYVPPGYVNAAPPASATGLKLVWKGRNAYTNGVETYVYQGKGLNAGDAGTVTLLLKNGTFLQS